MLPRELNGGKCSLSQGNERLCVTLTIDMNDKGMADFSSAGYSLTVLKSAARLTYEVADRLIKVPEGEVKLLLTGKCPEEVEVKLRSQLKQLYAICKSRQDFRKRYEVFASENNDNGDVSQVIIEELMLLTSSALPYLKDRALKETERAIEGLLEA